MDCPGEKGLNLRSGTTLESWQKDKNENQKREKNDLLEKVFKKTHEQNCALWGQNVSSKLREKILSMQKPRYQVAKELCPDCRSDVHSGMAGVGVKYDCDNCDWTYYYHNSERLVQVNFRESDDGYLPAGYYDQRRIVRDSEGVPPIKIPEWSNAAHKLERTDWLLTIKKVPDFYANRWDFETGCRIVESLTMLSKKFPQIPEISDAEELFKWGVEASEKIVQDFENERQKSFPTK